MFQAPDEAFRDEAAVAGIVRERADEDGHLAVAADRKPGSKNILIYVGEGGGQWPSGLRGCLGRYNEPCLGTFLKERSSSLVLRILAEVQTNRNEKSPKMIDLPNKNLP